MCFLQIYCLQYWKKHLKKVVAFSISIILVVLSVMMFLLSERTEARRQYHKMLDYCGDYELTVYHVEPNEIEKIGAMPGVDRYGVTQTMGSCLVGKIRYAYGMSDDMAKEMLHYRFLQGQYPKSEGEIAVPESMLTGVNSQAGIGDSVTFHFEDLDGTPSDQTFVLSGIIDPKLQRENTGVQWTSHEGVFAAPVDDPVPCVFIYQPQSPNAFCNLLLSVDEHIYTLPYDSKENTEWLDTGRKIQSDYRVSYGTRSYRYEYFSDNQNKKEGFTYKVGDDTRFMRIVFLCMILVAVISLVSVAYTVIAERIDSFRLLKYIGLSNFHLQGIILIELFVCTVFSAVIGIALGCGCHALQLWYQSKLGLVSYSGYTAEWLVQQITLSPWIWIAVVSVFIFAGTAVIPLIWVGRLNSASVREKSMKKRCCANNLILYRLFHDRTLQILQCVSLTLVLCTVTVVFLYYSNENKGTSYAGLGKISSQDAYLQHNVNIKDANVDCVLTGQMPPQSDGLGVYEMTDGLSSDIIQAVSQKGNVRAWGRWSNYVTAVYDEINAPNMLGVYRVEHLLNDDVRAKGKALFSIPILFVNSEMMAEIGAEPETKTVLVTLSGAPPFEAGECIPILTAINGEQAPLSTVSVPIEESLRLSEKSVNDNDFLNGIRSELGDRSSLIILLDYAEELNIPSAYYECAMLSFSKKQTEGEIAQWLPAMLPDTVSYVTQNTITAKLKKERLSQLSAVYTVFALFILLSMIGYYHVMEMNIQKNLMKFNLLHQIGMPFKEIKKRIYLAAMEIPLISGALAFILVFLFQSAERTSYEKYVVFLKQQQSGMFGNETLETLVKPNLSTMAPDDPWYGVTYALQQLEERWFLKAELWLPHPWIVLLICALIALIVIIVISILLSGAIEKKLEGRRINE